MDDKMLARLGAIVFIAIAIMATVVEMTRKDDAPTSPTVRVLQPERDLLREDQRRCQQLGEAAARDAVCLRTWAETRDRFLGRTSAPASPVSGEGR
jgi:conjugative transfer region protein TrbK